MLNRSDRKKHLIAQGAIYRAEVMLAKQAVQDGLRPETIARNAVHQAMLVGLAALKTRNIGGLPGINLQNLLPLAMSGVSALSKNKALVKVVLRGAVVAGSVAGVVRVLSKRKKKDASEDVQASSSP